MKLAPIVITGLVLFCSSQSELHGQSAETRALVDRLDTLGGVIRALETQVAELNTLLRAALPPSPIADIPAFELNIANAAVKGSVNAKIVLIEYSDFECPFCGRHAQTAYHELQRQFVDTGKIKYAFRHLPLEQLHPSALGAAEGAECAREQGKFWEMHDRLFANQQSLSPADLNNHAQALDLDPDKFQSCLIEGRMSGKVRADLAEAQRLGLRGTPAFVIGEVNSDGTVHVLKKLVGAQPFQVFQSALQGVLANPTNHDKEIVFK